MPTSRRPPLLPVPRTGGHEEAVPGAAGNRQCGIRKIPDPGRGFRLHREEPQDGEDTPPREQRPDDVCQETRNGTLPDAGTEHRQTHMHDELQRICALDFRRKMGNRGSF